MMMMMAWKISAKTGTAPDPCNQQQSGTGTRGRPEAGNVESSLDSGTIQPQTGTATIYAILLQKDAVIFREDHHQPKSVLG